MSDVLGRDEKEKDFRLRAASKLAAIAERLGVPAFLLTIILIAAGYALWSGGSWLAEHAIKPLVDAHMEFLKQTTKAIESQEESARLMSEGIESLSEGQKAIIGTQETIAKQSEEQTGILKTMVSEQKKLLEEVKKPEGSRGMP